MKYSVFIDRVKTKLRDAEAWPDSGSAVAEQVKLSFIAALTVASRLPMATLPSSLFTTGSELAGTQVSGNLQEYSFPADIFPYRNDLGIRAITMDGVLKSADGAEPYASLVRLASSRLHRESKLFNVDFEQRKIFALNVGTVLLDYLTVFAEPAVGDIATADYPLDGTHAEQAASLVSYHISGETIRDSAMAQFQAILTQEYGQPAPAGAEDGS